MVACHVVFKGVVSLREGLSAFICQWLSFFLQDLLNHRCEFFLLVKVLLVFFYHNVEILLDVAACEEVKRHGGVRAALVNPHILVVLKHYCKDERAE